MMRSGTRQAARRRFLKAACAWGAAPWLVPAAALGRAGAAPPSEQIRTALIGAGGRGGQILGGAGRVVAVCDVDAARAKAAAERVEARSGRRGCAVCRDFRDVLSRADVDAVVVATPDHWHVPIALAAVRAGKAAYVEKPLSLTVRQGRVLADAARRYRAVVQVGSQQRSDEKFIRACELVRNGLLGRLRRVLVTIPTRGGSDAPWTPQPPPPELDYDLWLGPAPWAPYHPDRCHYKFRFVSDYSGGDVTNWGAHHLDIAQWALDADVGGPLRVEGRGKRNVRGLHDVFYDVAVDFTYPDGVVVQLRSGGNGVRFEGDAGWIYVDRGRLETHPAGLRDSRLGPGSVRLPRPPREAGGSHMGVWLLAVRQGDPGLASAPPEVGHRSATVCHLANIAMMLRRPLQWDPQGERFVGDDQANRLLERPMREPWRLG